MDLPIPPYQFEKLKSNITYGELQGMPFEEVSVWVDELRNELLDKWDDGLPPYIGTDTDKIIDRFKKLKDYDMSDMFFDDVLYPDYIGFIKNFSKMGNGVNQFFPALLKSRIHGKSIHDYLSNENLWLDFKHTIVQKVRFDKMFQFSKYVSKTDYWEVVEEYAPFYDDDGKILPPIVSLKHYDYPIDEQLSDEKTWEGFTTLLENDENIGFWFEDYDFNRKNDFFHRMRLPSSFVEKLLKTPKYGFKSGDNRFGFNQDGDEKYYAVRYYKKDTKVFPEMFQTLRVGLNQVAVNFPPLTARWIYEKYLDTETPKDKYKVYDSSSGWGGRLLGSLCSNLPIHYIGTDVNKSNQGCYEELGNFYNKHTGGKNTYEIYYDGSEVIHQNKDFMNKHENDVDLVFTSPPYFNREVYSTDEEQSCFKFPTYPDWLDGFLEQTLSTAYKLLKPECYCIINICDIKVGREIIPLEQDTIRKGMKVGFNFIGKMGMTMTRMIGLNPTDSKNYWLDMKTQTTYKTEPILIFKKG